MENCTKQSLRIAPYSWVVELLVHDLGGEHDRKGAVVEFGEVDKVDVAGA